MKSTALLLALLLPLSAFASTPLDVKTADVMNIGSTLGQNGDMTYVGIIVDSSDIVVRSGRKGFLPGLATGIVNLVSGAEVGYKNVTVHRYVIRLDTPGGGVARLVTVYQAGSPLLEAGIPVFVTAGGGDCYGSPHSWIRVVPSSTPEVYGRKGLEETRYEKERKNGHPLF